MGILPDLTHGHGAGSSLPLPALILPGVSTLVAVAVSWISIWLQLSNYRKPLLQRMVVRIMVMVPLYAVASLISLLSLEAAFFIDVIRDIYEAFVIYCFFVLLLDYLGGERSLLMMLHGRPPIPSIFPVNLWRHEIDVSDPYTLLFLKRGILQYVQVKPILALVTLTMKATGTYNEGDFRARSGYLYVSIIYNISICLALWCLAVFWMCVNSDLRPFRPVPKFLCVKGILFFSFWQSIIISSLVALGAITRLGVYRDREHISLGLNDILICFEMPFFAAAHMFAFSYRDFTQLPTVKDGSYVIHVARMKLSYAFRDAFGLKDLVEDMRTTLRGKGINYRAFEPSEGGIHIGAARERRIRAGLRYSAGGKRKYWLPEARNLSRGVGYEDNAVVAPLLAGEAIHTVHHTQDMRNNPITSPSIANDEGDPTDDDVCILKFSDALADPNGADEQLYRQVKTYLFGDYLYPVIDVSLEEARRAIWEGDIRVARESTSTAATRNENVSSSSGVGTTNYGATQDGRRLALGYEDEEQHSVGFGDGDKPVSVPGSVKLGWTKATGESRPSKPFYRLPSLLPGKSSPSGNPPGFSPISSRSRSASRTGTPPIVEHSRASLNREDAVDLITPNTYHHRASPAFITHSHSSRSPSGNDHHIAHGSNLDSAPSKDTNVGEVGYPGDVVRAQTPPPHVHTEGYRFGEPFEDDSNPWI